MPTARFPMNLGDAATYLRCSPATLTKRMRQLHLEPVTSADDGRAKWVSDEQMLILVQHWGTDEQEAEVQRFAQDPARNSARAPQHDSQRLAQHLRPLAPTPDGGYRDRHPARMSAFLGSLDDCALRAPRLPLLLRGFHGSALRDMGQGLADLLACPPETYVPAHPRLSEYHHVYLLDLHGLLALVRESSGPQPDAVLDLVKREIAKVHPWQSVIVLAEHVEILDVRGGTLEAQLWEALTAPNELAIVGVYATDDHEPTGNFRRLNPHSARILHQLIHKHTPAETRTFLQHCCFPGWRDERNFIFEDDAFDTVMALEPGVCIDGRRETLPYMAADLGWQTITTALAPDPAAALRTLAADAHDALESLLAAPLPSDPQAPALRSLLLQLEADFQHVIEHPLPASRRLPDGREVRVLTREHVTAQLIAINKSCFVWDQIGFVSS